MEVELVCRYCSVLITEYYVIIFLNVSSSCIKRHKMDFKMDICEL